MEVQTESNITKEDNFIKKPRKPKTLKKDLYKKQQPEIAQRLIKFLDPIEGKAFVLYKVDHDEEQKKQILDLIPEIRNMEKEPLLFPYTELTLYFLQHKLSSYGTL